MFLYFTDNPQEALKYFEQSLALRLGLWEQHPAIGSTYNNISLCYQRLGEHDKALDFSRKGLAAKRRFKGNGKEMVNSLNNMAVNLCLVSGSHREAIELLKEALLILEKLGLDTSDAATIYTSMSFVYQRMGRLDGALPWCHKAVDLRRKINGSTHTITIRLVIRLGSMLYQMTKYEDARDLLETQIVDNQTNSGDDLQKSAELLRKVYLKTGENAKADLIQQKSIRDLVVLLNEERNAVQPSLKDMTKEGTENNIAKQETTGNTEKLPKETDVLNLDGIDSDDDLYGPENSSSAETTLQFQSIKTKIDEPQVKPSNYTQSDSEKLMIVRCQSEEDLYCSSKDTDGRMSVSASPESVYVDADVTDDEVEVEDEDIFHRVGITNSIRSSNQVQHPVAEMKPVAILERNQQKQQIKRPQQLQVSSQSAFTSVGRSSTRLDNSILDNSVIDNNRNHHQSLSNVRELPVSQPEDETCNRPFQISSGAVTQQHQPNNKTSDLDNRGRQAPSITLRQSNNPFHSCQIGYQQYRPEPTYVQSLPYLGNGNDQTGRRGKSSEVSNFGVNNNRVSVPTRQTWDTSSTNGFRRTTFEDLEDFKLLTPKQIEGSNNVLRLVFGDYNDSSDEDLFS